MHIEGVEKVKRALEKMHVRYNDRMNRGLKKAGLFLQRESQKVVPVDTGALRNSASTRSKGAGMKTEVTVGYMQKYAVFVHENLEARHKPGKIAKYLEKPMQDNAKQIAQIVRDELKS